MARLALCLAILLTGCGLVSRDYDVEQPFRAGGGAPPFGQNFDSKKLTGALSADVGKISSVTLKAARIEATDNNGGIAFVSAVIISVAPAHGPDVLLAKLPAPPAAGQTSAKLDVLPVELKPYLQAGSPVSASVEYAPTPINARELKLVLTLHGSLL